LVLALSVIIAWGSTSLGALTQNMITFNTYFGAVVFLTFFWRRLTVPAILIGFFIWMALWAASAAVPWIPAAAQSDALLAKTRVVTDNIARPANQKDVDAGRAKKIGDAIVEAKDRAPEPCFFEKIVAIDPYDVNSKMTGGGRFLVENYVVNMVVPAKNFSAPQLSCARWLFDGLFPFVCLIGISLVTKRSAPERAPAFYARMKTPVAATPEMDHVEVETNEAHPENVEHLKLFPGSDWEFAKWTKEDYLGFFGCYALVVVILGILWGVLHIGA